MNAAYTEYAQNGLIAIAVILAGMIKIPKIEINVWSWLADKIGKAFNREVLNQVKEIRAELNQHIQDEDKEKARASRYRILRCEGELRRGEDHGIYSKEAFDELIHDIDWYIDFCDEHEDYKNSVAVSAINYIRETYERYKDNHMFLQ